MKSFYTLRAARRAVQQSSIAKHKHRNPFLHPVSYRHFHASACLQRIETHILSDIGEGVKEVQIIQWFVEEGATVEEWAPLCEVQSDKASVEITSKFSGVIKKLHYETDAVVQVGDGMLDIEVEGEDDAEPEPEAEKESEPKREAEAAPKQDSAEPQEKESPEPTQEIEAEETPAPEVEEHIPLGSKAPESTPSGKHANLATPAVRSMLKQNGLDISEIKGTGRDGRVLKEDIQRHLEKPKEPQQTASKLQYQPPSSPALDAKQEETQQSLSPVQSAMFKTMTKSLAIPHFLYSDSIDVTSLAGMRSRLNQRRNPQNDPKFSYMPFVIKAVSLAMNKYPLLNARLDTADSSKPKLLMRKNHNIGVAMDTPGGLMVPVIKTVNARSITSIAHELHRLSELGTAGKLSSEDLKGGTITVSNIGSIGGGVVAPVIVEGQVAIMGMGKIKPVPVFAADGKTVEGADMLSVSWSADHRVVDGATMARMATVVQEYLERPETMIVDMS
jgi:2-oxoisovalerate dehydrogenase E2 component (dihydrolipoyl transacylase)